MEDLELRPGLVIPAAELSESASRSSGPGGQHVNKTNTRVTLRWDVAGSAVLDEGQRRRILRRLETRITRAGELYVHASRHRSQGRNRELARERLAELVCEALTTRRARVATKPGRGARQRALDAKRRRSETKQRRARVRRDDDA